MEPDAANPVPRRLKLETVLHNDPDGRVASALCSTRPEASAPSRAIVILSKKPWSDADIRAIVEGSETELNEYHRNDKFSKYDGRPPAPINEVSITLICPANDTDIAKYSEQKRHLVRETADVYQSATRPYVQQIPVEQLGWVQAIIDRRKEMDRLMYEDDGFMMVPDTKWDLKDPQMLYTLAIAKDPSLRSLRDLRGRHVPMLQRLRAGALATLHSKHGVSPSAVRVYMHYMPSFWWAHIHFAALTCTAAGATASVGKAVLLDDIVDNLVRDPDHYATAALTMVVGERDPLFHRLREAGAIDDCVQA